MLLFTILNFILFINIYKLRKDKRFLKYFLINLFIILFLFFLHMLEITLLERALFVNDELTFLRVDTLNLISKRTFIFDFINFWMNSIDFSFNGFILKLINIPVLLLVIVNLYRITKNIKIVKYFPIGLPALYHISFYDLRDTLILLFAILLIDSLVAEKKKINKIIVYSILLFGFRRFFVFIIFIAYIIHVLIKKMKSPNKLKKAINITLILIFVFLATFLFTKTSFFKSNYEYYSFLKENVEKRANEVLLNNVNIEETDTSKMYFVGFLRQVFSPLPSSLIKRLLQGSYSRDWLITYDILRIIQISFFYFVLFYLVLKIKKLKYYISNLGSFEIVFFLMSIGSAIIYTFYRFGASHIRNKMYLHIAFYILFFTIKKMKNEKEESKK